jgi:chromosome segregation ATPase
LQTQLAAAQELNASLQTAIADLQLQLVAASTATATVANTTELQQQLAAAQTDAASLQDIATSAVDAVAAKAAEVAAAERKCREAQAATAVLRNRLAAQEEEVRTLIFYLKFLQLSFQSLQILDLSA